MMEAVTLLLNDNALGLSYLFEDSTFQRPIFWKSFHILNVVDPVSYELSMI